jgi:glycosyltransferase involved in cell wall biosynthesis
VGTFDDYNKASIEPVFDKIKLVSLGKKLDLGRDSSKEYENIIIEIVKNYNIDVFWIPNPLMLNIHLIKTKPPCRVVTTFYDLIPLIFEDIYFKSWPKMMFQEYILRLTRIDKISDTLVPISESSKRDLMEILEINPIKLKTVYLGVKKSNIDNNYTGRKYSINEYILYVGGFDPRKNMEKAVLAFKKLIDTYGYFNLDFVIVCSYDEATKNRFLNFIKKLNVSGRIKLTGYVSEAELVGLYKDAKVFFFPSLYEGFGLPILEAMAIGTPIAASNCSSIPEVVGDAGLLFNPEDITDMAEKLNAILSNDELAGTLRVKGIKRANTFSWKQSAHELLNIFENVCNLSRSISRSFKIAYFSPVSPQKSGISTYTEELLPHLKKYAEVHLFLDDNVKPTNSFIKEKIRYFPYKDFYALLKKEKYDTIIYHVGNNTMHKYIYNTLLKHSGIVVLHDYILHPFIQHITALDGDSESYIIEMSSAYGSEGEKLAKDYVNGSYYPIDFVKYPLNERIIESSECVIVHSHYVKNLLEKYHHIKAIPHGRDAVELNEEFISKNKKALNLNDHQPILGCFGFMNSNKRINVLLDVFKDLTNEFPRAMLILAGDIDNNFKKDIIVRLKKYNLSNSILITGYNSEELYKKYLACTDIVINLRFPTMGETSGTLLDAMAFGKSVVVSNIGSYREFPDNCCWKVDVDNSEKELLLAYLRELISNKGLREKMGENAKQYIKKNHDWDNIALKYLEVIEKTL